VKDIVDRLTALAECDARAGEPLGKCMREAAEEIARLRKELKQGTEMLCNQAETILNYRATVEDLRRALLGLLDEAERAQDIALNELGQGLIDLNALKRAQAAIVKTKKGE
jgi:hypothetical protein